MKITVKTDHEFNVVHKPATITSSRDELEQALKLYKVLQSSVNLAFEESKAIESAIYSVSSLASIIQQLERFESSLHELLAYYVGLQSELIFAIRLKDLGGEL